jgi:hypothetical protein
LETLYNGFDTTVDATVGCSNGALQGGTVLELGCGTCYETPQSVTVKLLSACAMCDSVNDLYRHGTTLKARARLTKLSLCPCRVQLPQVYILRDECIEYQINLPHKRLVC